MEKNVVVRELNCRSYALNDGRTLKVSSGDVYGRVKLEPLYEEGSVSCYLLEVDFWFKDASGSCFKYSSVLQEGVFFPTELTQCTTEYREPEQYDFSFKTDYDGGDEYTFFLDGVKIKEHLVFMEAEYKIQFGVDKAVVYLNYYSTTFEKKILVKYDLLYNGLLWKNYFQEDNGLIMEYSEPYVKVSPSDCSFDIPESMNLLVEKL